ncbi:cell adhesion molecule DSCAM-like [Bolinopsis microptera]|uniref:cell adhesion molecule DSCAM-like n=1 Tax=Bolinopsis microptera TaxID=2820187 RepID=UPI00307A1B32
MSWHELMLQVLYLLLLCIRYTRQQDVPPNAMPYPQFFLQPQKQSVKREMTTTIDCGAYGGIGNLTYTFFKGDSPQYNMMSRLKSVEADPDTQISSYFIPKVSSEDAAYYQCVVSDDAGVIIYSNVIYLQVVDNYLTRGFPVLEDRLLLSTARLHVLRCKMPASNPPALPRWFKDNVPINQDDENMFVSHGTGVIEGENINIGDLVMFALNFEHDGMYTCAAYNYQLDDGSNQIDVAYYNVTIGTS